MLFNWFTPTAPKTTVETIGPGARMQIDAANAYYQAEHARANRLESERDALQAKLDRMMAPLKAANARRKATAKGEA